MRKHLSERNIVILLFVVVLISFSLAQEDSKKILDHSTSQSSKSATSVISDNQIQRLDSTLTK
jgi:uncharacterized protein YpmB